MFPGKKIVSWQKKIVSWQKKIVSWQKNWVRSLKRWHLCVQVCIFITKTKCKQKKIIINAGGGKLHKRIIRKTEKPLQNAWLCYSYLIDNCLSRFCHNISQRKKWISHLSKQLWKISLTLRANIESKKNYIFRNLK